VGSWLYCVAYRLALRGTGRDRQACAPRERCATF
jgi:hypothetical protein